MVHRVVGRQRTGFVVQGDGNGCTPEIVSSENILGRLVKVERDGRHVRLGLGTGTSVDRVVESHQAAVEVGMAGMARGPAALQAIKPV